MYFIFPQQYSSHIITSLQKTQNINDFFNILVQKWKNFKIFTFYLCALLVQSVHNHFQNAYFRYKNQIRKPLLININSQQSIFPIPVVSVHYFRKIVMDKYQQKIRHIILDHIKNYRKINSEMSQSIKVLFQIIWTCGMAETTRIKRVPGQGVMFYRQDKLLQKQKQRKQSIMKLSTNCQQFFSKIILNHIIQQTQQYYSQYYNSTLNKVSTIQQSKLIKQILLQQTNFSSYYFFLDHQKSLYMRSIYNKIVLNNLQFRLISENSFKSLVQTYKFNNNQIEKTEDIKTFFFVLKQVMHFQSVIKILETIFVDIISTAGKIINKKINKRKQYILDVLSLKKSIDLIIDQYGYKNFKLVTAKNKCFKSILDSIQSSRNLAEYADFIIKQCIKLKLDQQTCIQKFNDIFLLLAVTTSTDSFLLYHQQFLSKRLIQTLNQPKIQYQLLILKKLSQKMGLLSVSSHMSMLKDIQSSQQITQKFSNRLPFSSFKWNLKILNSSYWPDYINKEKISISFPNSLYSQVKVIEELYHQENQYRYLSWKIDKGVSLFQGKFMNKKYRFQADNLYMMILLLISEQQNHKILYGNLKQLVNYSKNQSSYSKHDRLSSLLYVLIQNRLILRTSSSQQQKYLPFSQGQSLQINLSYSPLQPIKPNQTILIKRSQQISKLLHESSIQKQKIYKQRQKQIQAILVKALKHSHATENNSMTFNELYQVVKTHHVLGLFNFSQTVVKQRLEELIVREFCVRDEQDRKVYHYIA